MKKEYTRAEIQQIIKQNQWLQKENKYLKKLTNSKRFVFAEKVATSYNVVFPQNTKRRHFVEVFGRINKKISDRRTQARIKHTQEQISKLSKDFTSIIVLNSIPWDIKLKQRPHHFAKEFHKLGFFVIYLEDNPLIGFRVVKDGLITINNHLFLDNIKPDKPRYFLTPNNMPTKFSTLQEIKSFGYQIIYDYLDEFHEDISGDLSIQLEVWDKLKKLSPALCLATASRLHQDLIKHLGPKQKLLLARNAVDVDHFNYEENKTATPPLDMKKIVERKTPVIGFYGALAPWIDFDLINKTALAHPEWNFVLLGVDYNGAAADLDKAPNVHNLGAKNYKNLPKYAHFFDCAIIPFKKGEIAKATSPVKLFEYMAAGLPTVCTRDLHECKGHDYVYMAKNDDEFSKMIALAIKDHKNPSARARLLDQAKQNTWSARVKDIKQLLQEH